MDRFSFFLGPITTLNNNKTLAIRLVPIGKSMYIRGVCELWTMNGEKGENKNQAERKEEIHKYTPHWDNLNPKIKS